MNTLEGKAWCILAGTKEIGPKTLWLISDYLSSRGKTASWLLENPDKINEVLPGNKAGIAWPDPLEQKCANVARPIGKEVTVLHPQHPDFPRGIRILKDKMSLPALLYASGNIALLKKPAVAIVGKRNAEAAAIAAADSLARELAGQGINVTSGYAPGIDSTAHLAALRAGGTTSIVLAEGIHHFQAKAEFKNHLTAENSLVISQFEPDAKWAAYMAMTRNKLVAALSKTLVVIVSGPERDGRGRNSGTFNAATAALKMDIPVFVASPASFADDPQGNRELLRKGCLEWDPAAGAAPILAAIPSAANKHSPAQLGLFEKNGD
jgi:DNA processing protein